MPKNILFLLLLLPVASGWVPLRTESRHYLTHAPRSMAAGGDAEDDVPAVASSVGAENPCWEDLYDDDCAMANAAAARFVAGKWIKSMPCAAGIEVGSSCMYRKLPSTAGEPSATQHRASY